MLPEQEKKLRAHLREISGLGTPAERIRIAAEEHSAMLHEQEDAKEHPLKGFQLPADQWALLLAHLQDGGGVPDSRMASKEGRSLDAILHDAIMNGDQATFWNELPHWLKSHWVSTGRVQRHPGGGISSGPHGPSAAFPMPPELLTPAPQEQA
jgi:hypothetical protein